MMQKKVLGLLLIGLLITYTTPAYASVYVLEGYLRFIAETLLLS